MQRNWIMFPPVTLQTLPKSLERLFDRVPSPSPDQPVVNGSWMQHEEQNNKTLRTVAKLATGGTEKCFELSHNCLPAVGNPIIHVLQNGRPRQEEIKTGFPEEPPGVMQWYVLISQFPLLFWRCTIHLVGISYFSTATKSIKGEQSHATTPL